MADDDNKNEYGKKDVNVDLSSEHLESIASIVADKLGPVFEKSFNGNGSDDDKKKGSGGDDDGKKKPMPSVDDIAKAVAERMASAAEDSNKGVFDLMFNEKLSEATADESFKSFLEGKDDYGNVRKDQLLGIDDYEKRVKALETLKTSFDEAVAGSESRRPHIDVKARKALEESEGRYGDIKKKWDKGEVGSSAELSDMFFDAISKEISALTK